MFLYFVVICVPREFALRIICYFQPRSHFQIHSFVPLSLLLTLQKSLPIISPAISMPVSMPAPSSPHLERTDPPPPPPQDASACLACAPRGLADGSELRVFVGPPSGEQ